MPRFSPCKLFLFVVIICDCCNCLADLANGLYTDIKLHSGKLTNRRLENSSFLVVFTTKDGDVPARDASLQEHNTYAF